MIKGPKHHLYKEKLRELEMEKKEPKEKGQEGCLNVSNSWGESEKKIVSPQWYPINRKKIQINKNSNTKHLIYSFKFVWTQFLKINIILIKYL